MFVRDLFEAQARRIVAIMPGGFHPFHPGHKSLYDWATKTFGSENVYVAATADTKTRPFPFDVKKKLASMAGVPAERFIQVKSPFNLNSYKDMLGDDAAIVFVRSLKDKGEQPLPDQTKKNGEPGYLRSYKGKNLRTSDEMGYMAYGPTIDFGFSGIQIKSASELRATWPEMSDEDKLKAAKLMYGNGAPVAVKLLNQALGDTEAPAEESVKELFGLGNDNTSIKSQDPNKIKVLSWIADRADGKEHFLSFYRKGAAWSGKLIYVKPDEAKKFISKFDNNPKYQDRMKRALTSVQNASKLFNNIGIKHSIRMADNVNEQQVNEIAPAVLWAGAKAAGWVLGWAARRGAVPVVKWAIRRHGGKIAIGGTAAYYAKKGWDWVESILGAEMVKFLVANKFSIMMAVILILGGVALQKFFTKKGDELVKKMADESIDISEDASPDEEDEFHRKLDKLVHKYFGHSSDEKPKKTKPKKKITEGYKLTLERDGDLMILHIVDTATGKRTEVRGKSGYESGNYDPTDKLHQLLDRLGKSVDISQLINGEPVGINPKHPHGAKAKAATNIAYNESTDLDSLRKFVRSQREAPDQVLYQMMMAPDTYGHAASNFVRSWYEKTKEENGLNDVDSALEIMVDQLGMNENFADGKVKGKSRPGRVKRSGASCNGSVTALRKRAKNSSGEKARMYHWCANMKSGKKKK